MPLLLLCLSDDDITEAQRQQLHDAAPDDMDVLITRDEEVIMKRLDDIEILAGWIKREWLPDMPNLRWLQQWGAGADWLMRNPELREKDFILTNTAGIHAIQISEHILAFMLAFGRKLPTAFHAQSAKKWTVDETKLGLPPAADVFELAGQTALIFGVGAIGERTAKLCNAFDMHVIGVRRNPDKGVAGIERMVAPDQLLDVLPDADWVIVTTPLTPETEGAFDAAAFRAMKPSAYIINIGRGPIIVEEDMIAALQNGEIAGAGLDVVENEPLSADSPLWEMHNIIITAHYSGRSAHYHARALEIFIDNLNRRKYGEPMRNVVDKYLAY